MLLIFMVQILVPLLAALSVLLWPQRSYLALATQINATLLIIAAVSAMGIWLFPPWWVPELMTAVLVVGIVRAVYRIGISSMKPASAAGWVATATYMVVGVVALLLLHEARTGYMPPRGVEVVDLGSPLDSGNYLIVNGGNALAINAHQLSLDTTIVKLRHWRGNAHALDIVAIDERGMRASGVRPASPASYRIFGTAVLAPCDGIVVTAADGLADMAVPERDNTHPAGNYVIIACKGVHLVLAHFQRSSLRVSAGDSIAAGQWIANVGNSGGSDEPHLHIHAQTAGPGQSPFAGDPVPIRILKRYMVRGDRFSIK